MDYEAPHDLSYDTLLDCAMRAAQETENELAHLRRIEQAARKLLDVLDSSRALTDLRAALDAEPESSKSQPEQRQWLPIETAPKDEAVLVVGEYGHVWTAKYEYVGPRAGTRWETYGLGRLPFEPTHWMPLPEPPTSQRQPDEPPAEQ